MRTQPENVTGLPPTDWRSQLRRVYASDLRRWLVLAPLIGAAAGLLGLGLSLIILDLLWRPVLAFYLQRPWVMVPGLAAGMLLAGIIMQRWTRDPYEHSTEEIIAAYHARGGKLDTRPFFAKIAAAIATVGLGGSAAMEGPGIYSGAVAGAQIWRWFARLHLSARDRRIMLVCGAAAGMAAVFRAPLTGTVFALEMPYRDDLAHDALVPSLIASSVAYAIVASVEGTAPLFAFHAPAAFSRSDVGWSALIGLLCGAAAGGFVWLYRRFKHAVERIARPHWLKMTAGGALAGLCGWMFVSLFPGALVPLGPNYEAAGMILNRSHPAAELLGFAALKLAATTFTLGVGGVSAMFVPLFVSGGSLGMALGQLLAPGAAPALFAAVGMASFLAAGYKTPLAAVVFVAEATGGHALIVPALIGAAVAYLVSGEISIAPAQRHNEGAEA